MVTWEDGKESENCRVDLKVAPERLNGTTKAFHPFQFMKPELQVLFFD